MKFAKQKQAKYIFQKTRNPKVIHNKTLINGNSKSNHYSQILYNHRFILFIF